MGPSLNKPPNYRAQQKPSNRNLQWKSFNHRSPNKKHSTTRSPIKTTQLRGPVCVRGCLVLSGISADMCSNTPRCKILQMVTYTGIYWNRTLYVLFGRSQCSVKCVVVHFLEISFIWILIKQLMPGHREPTYFTIFCIFTWQPAILNM